MNNGMKELFRLSYEMKRQKYPAVPAEWLAKTKYNDRTANGLTRCVIDFLTFKGWQAERINSMGRMVDDRKTYIDVVGRYKTIGSVKWVKGTSTAGTADISATIAGRSVKIEIKIGTDRQSHWQRNYQQVIERSGGLYFIAKSFQEFYRWYIKTFEL